MFSFGRTYLWFMPLLLLMTCGTPRGGGHVISAVELLYSNGTNEMWAYQMDSLGHVQALHIEVNAPDSAVYCFTLSKAQRQQVLHLAQEVVRLDTLIGKRFESSHHSTTKVVVYSKGKPFFSYDRYDQTYADPTFVLDRLADKLRKADNMHRRQKCAVAFSAPVLFQGHEDLLFLPSK